MQYQYQINYVFLHLYCAYYAQKKSKLKFIDQL